MIMSNYLYIAIAGAAGALARYSISGLVSRIFSSGFPYGTFVVNIIGCFFLGFIMKMSISTTIVPATWRVPIAVGFLGALTTFSTFGYETIKLLENSSYMLAFSNVIANVIIGLLATFMGIILSKILFGG